MYRKAQAFLSKLNLLHNIGILKKFAKNSKIVAMVKSNAYGHGIRSTSLTLKSDVDMFGVCSLDEGMIIRNLNIRIPILLAEGVFAKEELEIASKNLMDIAFHNQEQIRWLENTTLPVPITAWLKVDTGMGRLGFNMQEIISIYDLIKKRQDVKKICIMSHFACADEKSHPLNEHQIKNFQDLKKIMPDCLFSMNNSAGLLNFPSLNDDFVRVGIAMYGYSPCKNITNFDLDLKPVMHLKTKIIAIKDKKIGDSIGYGARYKCYQDSKIAIIAFGYGDGYPSDAKDGTPVLIREQECPIVGKVSMDMIAVDVTKLESVEINDDVTLWGDEKLSLEKVVSFTSSSSYDALTKIQNRVNFNWY
jgi:alanine racemase